MNKVLIFHGLYDDLGRITEHNDITLDQTVPDQAVSLRELLRRAEAGMPISFNSTNYDFEDEDKITNEMISNYEDDFIDPTFSSEYADSETIKEGREEVLEEQAEEQAEKQVEENFQTPEKQ